MLKDAPSGVGPSGVGSLSLADLTTYSTQSSGSLVVKALASHASGRGFDPPGGLSSKNPVGWESECL